MEQITKRDGVIYYGEQRCTDIDQAYVRFRRDYHASIGRDAFRRLDRLGQRTERIHGFGFCFAGVPVSGDDGERMGRVPYRLLGLVGVHYCRIIGCWDYSDVEDDEFDRWFDCIFTRRSGRLSMVGRKDKAGRTSMNLKRRYR